MALFYINFFSIKSYYYNDDVFNFDYGQAKAAVGNYQVHFNSQAIVMQLSECRKPRKSSWTSLRRSWSQITLTSPGSPDASLWMGRCVKNQLDLVIIDLHSYLWSCLIFSSYWLEFLSFSRLDWHGNFT